MISSGGFVCSLFGVRGVLVSGISVFFYFRVSFLIIVFVVIRYEFRFFRVWVFFAYLFFCRGGVISKFMLILDEYKICVS